jgi:DNA repair exonuclease SbcCD ATPase subunit
MQFFPVLLLCLASSAAASRTESTVTPIQKVLQMMDGMLQNAKKDKHDETTRFSAFQQWCESTKSEKDRDIAAAADQIIQLEADISKSEADADRLGEEIDELNKDTDQWTGESNKATSVRKAENKEYQATHLDYSESVDALERAIQVLKKRAKDVPQSLMQLKKVSEIKRLPTQARHVLASFLQSAASSEAGAPEANSYEFQSGSVVDMLEKLRIRFQDERLVLEKEEMNKKAAYDQMMQKLTDDINYAKKQVSEKKQAKGQATRDAAEAKGDLASTQKAKGEDETFLRETLAECHSKSKDYESRQVTRAEEIEAIQKAIEIISSPEVSGAGEKHLPGAFIQKHATAFAQLRKSNNSGKEKAVSLLLQASQEANSDLLAMVANRVSEDPFGKVKKMIKDLIVKLTEEANAEADHKGFCDAELATNKATRDDKSAEVSSLTAQIDELTSKNAKLAQDIADLNQAVAESDARVKEATEARNKEKAANAATLADAKAASAAVTQAIEVLNKYYAKAASNTALVQAENEPAPETFDSAYKGQQSESGGVIGMLEVIQSDFARLEAETSSGEDEATREHDTLLAESAQDKEVKEKEARHKGFDKVRTERALNQSKKDLKATQAELDAALEYFDKLKPQCIDTGLSYADRVAKRKAEIVSLQEALKVLDGEDI